MSTVSDLLRPGQSDLGACEREPIRIPGAIQPYGALLVIDPESLKIVQAAVSPGLPPARIGQTIGEAFLTLVGVDSTLPARVPQLGVAHLGGARLDPSEPQKEHHLVAHRSGGMIVLELEEAVTGAPGSFEDLYPSVQNFLAEMEAAADVQALCALACRQVRHITGLDRVMVYQFDADWHGTVIAEDRNDLLPSYLNHRFPASDIPAQARELYRLNRLRLIADADYRPVPIEPALNPHTGRPVDLSLAVLRSVSPIHLEYMRNMGTWASMSVSLLRDGQLWGLLSCHSRDPHRVPLHVRTACDFLGQILSLQIAAKEHASAATDRIALNKLQGKLLTAMASGNSLVAALSGRPEELLGLAGASGAAVVFGGECALVGAAPGQDAINRIVSWLAERGKDVFATDSLSAHLPEAKEWKDTAAGLLAVSISQLYDSCVLWFRPEVVRTVEWGGNPHKAAAPIPGDARIHPRKSFEAWCETVSLRSMPFSDAEVDAVTTLRTGIVDIVLRRAEEMAALNEQLTTSNKELEAFSYSVSHDLRAPFRHIVGYSELLKSHAGDVLDERGERYIATIIESAVSAGTLVDNLLSFAQMGRNSLHQIKVDMNALVAEERRRLEPELAGRDIEWQVADLPSAYADLTMLRLVIQNLVGNAVKFTRHRETAIIEVGAEAFDTETIYFVRDNGCGFDMTYAHKLFGVFQRLHGVEEFEGTGIGLANVKRILDRHGGRVWADAKIDEGATFFFALPKQGS